MSQKVIIISWDSVKGIGRTLKLEGEVSIIAEKIPENCAVVFVDLQEWLNAKRGST